MSLTYEWQETKPLDHYPLVFQGFKHGAGSEVWQPELKLESKRDSGIANDSLRFCVTRLAPKLSSF